jgi:serine/threonine protein kinase
MELCDTDLDTILYKKKRGFNEMEIFLILKQFNNILIKMHENNIIHRDLKLKNILIKKNNSSNILKFDIKLSDFGFSTILKDDVTHTKLGTPQQWHQKY